MVNCLRVSISVVGRTPRTGNRNTHSTLVPLGSTIPETLPFNPLITEEIVITVITPITIPRIVNPERSLFARNVSSAIVTVSLRSPIRIQSLVPPFTYHLPLGHLPLLLKLRPQSHNRIQI